MKKNNCFSLGVLVSFSCASAMERNGTDVSVPIQCGAIQDGSVGSLGTQVPQQLPIVSRKVLDRQSLPQDTRSFLEDAAEKEGVNTNMLVECLRDRIDEDLGVKNKWFRALAGSYASWSKASTLDNQGAVKELKKIESYVQPESSSQPMYHSLAERHWYVGALVNKLVAHEAEQFKNVKGSTIDTVLDSQRKIGNLSLAMTAVIKQKVKPEVFDRLDHRLADNVILFSGQDIQLIPLFANKRVDVNGGKLVTSIDSKYAKSTDLDGNTVIWDLEKGCSINIDDRGIQWERRRSQESYDPHAVIDAADEHAIFTDVRYQPLIASYPRHIDFVKNEGADGYLMVLFKRPTKESRLCRQAFLNSCGNQEELHQLLNSKTFKKIEGFPATNLKLLIDKELQNIQSKL